MALTSFFFFSFLPSFFDRGRPWPEALGRLSPSGDSTILPSLRAAQRLPQAGDGGVQVVHEVNEQGRQNVEGRVAETDPDSTFEQLAGR